MNVKRKIVHIIPSEKFTSGYINYMEKTFDHIDHIFIVYSNKYKLSLEKKEYSNDVVTIIEWLDIRRKQLIKYLEEADIIIISGVFASVDFYTNLYHRKNIWSKVYLHFWGGDFYGYRGVKSFSKKWIKKMLLSKYIKKCGGIITLIPADYDELIKIFPNDRPHYVAKMPTMDEHQDLEKFVNTMTSPAKILVGNSAAPENCHLESLAILERFRDKDMQIVCPLSYGGGDEYVKKVLLYGKKLFGKKFVPLLDYLDADKYLSLLGEVSVAVFYNNRQQAMGNINALLRMGKKVYLRKGTAMWKDYTENNLLVYDINDINDLVFRDFIAFGKNDSYNNIIKMEKRDKKYEDGWSKIFKEVL